MTHVGLQGMTPSVMKIHKRKSRFRYRRDYVITLKDGNLVQVGGVLGRRAQNNCHIQLMLVVSRIDVVQEQAIDASEIKKVELRQKKALVGFKNVDSILEQLLFQDKRPNVALVFATTSITMADFNAQKKSINDIRLCSK